MPISLLRKRGVALVLALPVTLALWAFWLEPAGLRNENYELELPGWPPACDGLRVAVLADLHVGSPFNGLAKLERIVELTEDARPDVVLLAGDYVIHEVLGGRFVPPEDTARALTPLLASARVYAVLGNHDRWLGVERVRGAFERVGIEVLDDAAVLVERGACRFWVAGVSDFAEGPHDVERALLKVPEDDAVVVFTHNPDVFPEVPARVLLTVAGHTHGGQVYFPFVGRLVVPSVYGERYAIGEVVEHGRHLFVSSGLGTSVFPVRFLVPPEISVLDLRGETGRAAATRP